MEKRERVILEGMGIEAAIVGSGSDRVLDRTLPVNLARHCVEILGRSGIEASWAPDHDDNLRAWVYIAEAVD
jgi:hypothetical protein